jgi:hypothetical protein
VLDGEEGSWSRGTGPAVLLVQVACVASGEDLAVAAAGSVLTGNHGHSLWRTVVVGARGNGSQSTSWQGRCRRGWTEEIEGVGTGTQVERGRGSLIMTMGEWPWG